MESIIDCLPLNFLNKKIFLRFQIFCAYVKDPNGAVLGWTAYHIYIFDDENYRSSCHGLHNIET